MTKKIHTAPPGWASRLLRWLFPPHRVDELEGDLDELFQQRVATLGLAQARWRYTRDVVSLLRPSLLKREQTDYSSQPPYAIFSLHPDMLRNYFKIALRTLLKKKVYSLIHVTGLSIGLWACMMVASVVLNDLSYDQQWTRKNDIYRLISVNKMGEGLYDRFPSTFAGLAPQLQKQYSEVESHAELYTTDLHLNLGPDGHGDEVKTRVLHADTTAWKMLDFHILAGTPAAYKYGNRNLVITRSFKEKYFATTNPVGKIVHDLPAFDAIANPYLITGVIDDLPANSYFGADVVFLHKGRTEELSAKEYGTFSKNYIVLKPGTDVTRFTSKVNRWYTQFTGGKPKYQFECQSLKDIHLHSDFDKRDASSGSAQRMYIFSGIAFLLLGIACINFVNLSTARAITRLKETGVRKILSASRTQLMLQFLAEAWLVFGVASVLAIGLYVSSSTAVETYLGHPLVETVISDWPHLLSVVVVVILTSLLTGLYPAWLISGLKPTDTLKGMVLSRSAFGQNQLRRSLVVLQFCVSVFVLLALVVVREQLAFIQNQDLGFNKTNLLSIDQVSWDGKSDAFKNEILKIPGVEQASVSQWLPTYGAGFMSKEIADPANASAKINVWFISGDLDLASTLQLKLNKGRFFDQTFGTDALNADSLQSIDWAKYEETTKYQHSLITASAAKILHVEKLDQQIKQAFTIPVGVVENFNNESLHEPLKPTIIIANKSARYGGMLLRIKPGTEQSVRMALRNRWKQFFPNKVLDVSRVSDLLDKQYEAEHKLGQFFSFFSGLTLFLSALGIFGLVIQAAEQRAKEIGIRQVLGASVVSIVQLLTQDFTKLVLIALVITSPVGWYAMKYWLQSFAYKITIEWWMFALVGLLAVGIALLTVGYQAVKAALVNPVRSLRSE